MKMVRINFCVSLLFLILLCISVIETRAQGNALKLDGRDDIFFSSAPAIGSQCTIELWVYPNALPARTTFLFTFNSGSYQNFAEWINSIVLEPSGKVFFYVWDGGPQKAYSRKTLPLYSWTHLAGILSQNSIQFYVNGSLEATIRIGQPQAFPENMSINGSDGHSWEWDGKLNGQIDELRIWNRALSPVEIQENMNKELSGTERGLVAYYKFNETSGKTAYDSSPSRRYNGQLISGANFVSSTAPIKPPYPPELSITAAFSGQDGVLKAGQTGTISITVQNSGKGDAEKISAQLSTTNKIVGFSFESSRFVGKITAGSSGTSSFNLNADQNLEKGNIDFSIQVSAEGGYSANTSIIVPTKAFYTQPQFPADLLVENVQFIEPSGNRALDGYESGKIQLTLANKGRGEAQNVQVSLSPLASAEGLTYTPTQVVERVNAKSSAVVTFPITAAGRIASLPRTFRIQAAEEFGFDADPVRINFETKAFEAPDMRIEKVAINDREEGDAYGNGNSIIEPNESIVVTAFVQNLGAGAAEQVKATIRLEGTDPNLQCPDNGKVIDLAAIAPGDYKPVLFYFFTSKRYSGTSIPIKIVLTESKGDYGKTVDLGLKMNERTANIVDVNIAKIERPKPEIKTIAEASQSDVDVVLQKSKNNKPDDFAVIIGIENYKYAPKVTYAERDAGAFYNYAAQVLGIPERNVYYLVNDGATVGEFKKLFEKDGWIAKRTTPNSDIFVYYSGHGAPNLKDKSPYIIPYDIDPNYAGTGFSLNAMYEALGGLNARSVTVILDACFSGQSREKEMLLTEARPIFIKVEGPAAYEKLTVFAAASEAEISSGYPEQRHGIFTYFLLKGLQGAADANADKKITVGELFNYLKPNVKRTAGARDREQTPTLVTKNAERIVLTF